MLLVEVFATEIKIFDLQKVCLIVFAFDCLIFYGSKVRLQPHDRDPLILQFGGYLDPLIDSQKGFDISGRKCFYTGHISDYTS